MPDHSLIPVRAVVETPPFGRLTPRSRLVGLGALIPPGAGRTGGRERSRTAARRLSSLMPDRWVMAVRLSDARLTWARSLIRRGCGFCLFRDHKSGNFQGPEARRHLAWLHPARHASRWARAPVERVRKRRAGVRAPLLKVPNPVKPVPTGIEGYMASDFGFLKYVLSGFRVGARHFNDLSELQA